MLNFLNDLGLIFPNGYWLFQGNTIHNRVVWQVYFDKTKQSKEIKGMLMINAYAFI